MRKRVLVMLAVLLCSATFGLLFLSGYVGNSAVRVRREHGLKLPHSARAFVCRGDAWMHLFMDSGAASAFEMDARDLPSFLAQFKILQTKECLPGCIFPGNSQYQLHRAWMSGISMKTYRCASPTGDSLEVQIGTIDEAHVGVLLYTDWN